VSINQVICNYFPRKYTGIKQLLKRETIKVNKMKVELIMKITQKYIKRTVSVAIIFPLIVMISFSQSKYNGYWWTSLQNEVTSNNNSMLKLLKEQYVQGYLEGSVEAGTKTEEFISAFLKEMGKSDDIELIKGSFGVYSTLRSVNVHNYVIMLDNIYSDKKNLVIEIGDAMRVIVKMMAGASQEEIGWWMTFYRSDYETKKIMNKKLFEKMGIIPKE
jgi:hypothetical protein